MIPLFLYSLFFFILKNDEDGNSFSQVRLNCLLNWGSAMPPPTSLVVVVTVIFDIPSLLQWDVMRRRGNTFVCTQLTARHGTDRIKLDSSFKSCWLKQFIHGLKCKSYYYYHYEIRERESLYIYIYLNCTESSLSCWRKEGRADGGEGGR